MEPGEILKILENVHTTDEEHELEAWTKLVPLIEHADTDPLAAWGIALAIGVPGLDLERRTELARRLVGAWPQDATVMGALGESTQHLTDVSSLNDPPPDDPVFELVATALKDLLDAATNDEARMAAASGLTTAARVCGRSWDAVAESAHQTLIALAPDDWSHQYNLGLFRKNRGRFAEGVAANTRATELGGGDEESVIWNLGICATGAGEGAVALEQWKRVGLELQLGEDGLPSGGFAQVQVQLAQRPLAERSADDDTPGLEETVWVDRISPCHGRIVSALMGDVGVDYGDVVLFDGAPISTSDDGERPVPVFPHLATLSRGGFSVYSFAATPSADGAVAAVSERLGEGALLYVHTDHETGSGRVVTGKLVVSETRDSEEVGRALDAATADPALHIYVPDLWAQLGDAARADEERPHHDTLRAVS